MVAYGFGVKGLGLMPEVIVEDGLLLPLPGHGEREISGSGFRVPGFALGFGFRVSGSRF